MITAQFDADGQIVVQDGETSMVYPSTEGDTPAHARLRAWLDDGGEIAPPSPPSIDDLQTAARVAIIARADAFTAPILSKYPAAERAGWDKREAEARTIISADDKAAAIAATTIIRSLAAATGEDAETTVARAEKIVAKATEFAAISAAVEIMRDQAIRAINAVEDVADMPATLATLDAQAKALAAQYGLA